MKQITTLLLLSFLTINISAQKNKIKEIRTYYYDISKQISSKSLYVNELILNKNGKEQSRWPAVGYYYEKINFFYDTAPAHWEAKGKESLKKVTTEQVYAARNIKTEYLFKNKKIVFCFIKQTDVGEHRYYFAKGKLIKYLEKLNSDSSEFDKKYNTEILEQAKKLQKLYLFIMN